MIQSINTSATIHTGQTETFVQVDFTMCSWILTRIITRLPDMNYFSYLTSDMLIKLFQLAGYLELRFVRICEAFGRGSLFTYMCCSHCFCLFFVFARHVILSACSCRCRTFQVLFLIQSGINYFILLSHSPNHNS